MRSLTPEELREFVKTDVGVNYLLKRLPGGLLGEIAALKKLESMGLSVSAAKLNEKERDLIVEGQDDGKKARVEIKSIAEGSNTFLVSRCPDPGASDFWIFVRGLDEFCVLTTQEAARVWRDNPYNQGIEDDSARTTNGTRKTGDIRWHHLAAFADAWDKLR